MFCLNDSIRCCIKCAHFSPNHQGHQVVVKSEALNRLSSEINECKTMLPLICERINGSKAILKTQFDELGEQEKTNLEELDEVCSNLILKIEELRTTTNLKISQNYEALKADFVEKLEKLGFLEDQVQGMSRLSDDLTLYQKAKELSAVNPLLIVDTKPEVLLQFRNQSTLSNLLESLCYLELRRPNIIEDNKVYYLSRGSKDILSFDFEAQEFKSMIIKSTESIPRWAGFVFLQNGKILVTGGKPNKESGSRNSAFYVDTETLETDRKSVV